ncbi:MAG: DUF4169 family protein [Myxococcota bacterium]
MGNVVNLNKFRKRKAKVEREKRAETNRRLHGRTAAERARDELQKRQLTSKLDGARLESTRRASESKSNSESELGSRSEADEE